jgi:hypothetical protein
MYEVNQTQMVVTNFLITTEAIVLLNQYSNDNLVAIDMLDDPTASLVLAQFRFNTSNNKTVYSKKKGGFGTATI